MAIIINTLPKTDKKMRDIINYRYNNIILQG